MGAMAGMGGMVDPAALMVKEEAAPEEELGEPCVLDTFNCDLNLNIDESGYNSLLNLDKSYKPTLK